MIDHNPPKVPPELRKKVLFQNRGEDTIHITYLRFQSNMHPRQWDTLGDEVKLSQGHIYLLPICGTGTIFVRWRQALEDRADSYEVLFDKAGNPYPYLFGGDKWTMMLRHAALREVEKHGSN